MLEDARCLKSLGIVFFIFEGSVTLLTLCLKLTSSLSNLTVTNDLLLATISGSILLGVGLGIIFRINGTTGGTDLIGLLTNKYIPSLSIPVLMGIADFIVETKAQFG